MQPISAQHEPCPAGGVGRVTVTRCEQPDASDRCVPPLRAILAAKGSGVTALPPDTGRVPAGACLLNRRARTP